MISTLDETIPFSRRHPGKTIRDIIRYDSGYLKDLFIKDSRLCFTEDCFAEICRLTYGHRDNWDNWEKPNCQTKSIFSQLKSYKTPYLYDFNDAKLKELNDYRINSL